MSGLVAYAASSSEDEDMDVGRLEGRSSSLGEMIANREGVEAVDSSNGGGVDGDVIIGVSGTQDVADNGAEEQGGNGQTDDLIGEKELLQQAESHDKGENEQFQIISTKGIPTLAPPPPTIDLPEGFPPSPPGSPSQPLTAKLQNWAQLRRHGTHFNKTLVNSVAFKNPALLTSLCERFEINPHDSNFRTDVYDPNAFPEEAYFEKIEERQKLIVSSRGAAAGVEGVGASSGSGAAGICGGGTISSKWQAGGRLNT